MGLLAYFFFHTILLYRFFFYRNVDILYFASIRCFIFPQSELQTYTKFKIVEKKKFRRGGKIILPGRRMENN